MKIYRFGSKKAIDSPEITFLLKNFSRRYKNSYDLYNFLFNYFTLSVFKETIIKNNRKGVFLKTKNNIIAYDPDSLSFLLNSFVSRSYYEVPDQLVKAVVRDINTNLTKASQVLEPLPIKNLKESHPEIQLYSAITSLK